MARLGDHRVRAVEQGNSGQHRRVFAVDAMVRRSPAPQRGIVHERQIIENERRRVNHLDSTRGVERELLAPAHMGGDHDRHHRANALARSQQAVAHGAVQSLRVSMLRRHELREPCVQKSSDSLGLTLEWQRQWCQSPLDDRSRLVVDPPISIGIAVVSCGSARRPPAANAIMHLFSISALACR